MRTILGITVAAALLGACSQAEAPVAQSSKDADFQKSLQERLLDAKPGDVVDIPAGTYRFDRSLSLRADGVTIRGAGHDKTILSFKGQKGAGEGLQLGQSGHTVAGQITGTEG